MPIEEIRIKGMHCDACEKTIVRALTGAGITVESISYVEGKARINHRGVPRDTIANVLNEKGYLLEEVSAAEAPVVHTRVVDRISTFKAERDIFRNGVLMLGMLLAVQALLALVLYPLVPGYSQEQFSLFLYIPIVIAANTAALWYQRAYLREVSRITDLMVGATIGMTTGFAAGAIVGLTNGIFAGSLVGVILGIAAGAYAGERSGAIGILGGMVAGFISGTTGAVLIAAMTQSHAAAFLPLVIVICIAALAVLVRVIVDEHGGGAYEMRPWHFTPVLIFSLALMLAISAVMLLAPKALH
jgi:copper chaperone CopZ